ncbi:MAG: DUF805 domain-containing protein [Chitinophagaceae bacterium]|nr:DUF805 domain-containing protein [Chitinophagaceae bacterium]
MEQNSSNNMFTWWKKAVFENYANFKGRARRAEYWYFTLTNFVLIVPFYFLLTAGALYQSEALTITGGIIYFVVILVTFIPSLATGVRRLHDTGKSGWSLLVSLIPFVGGIILLVWLFTDGNRFANKYGEDPKNPEGPTFDFEQRVVNQ